MCVINVSFLTNLCEDKPSLLVKLREWGFIPNEGDYKCPKCSGTLKLYNDSRSMDGWLWHCRSLVSKYKKKRRPCCTQISFRTNTFFEHSQLSIFQILGFVDMWVHGTSLTLIGRHLCICSRTCVYWASFCREVLVEAYLLDEHDNPLGGPGRTVEINETNFSKRKYHRGRPLNDAWVFGAYERETGRASMSIVIDGSVATLVSIIEKWVLPGTLIISDCWKECNGLRDVYDHLKVNNSFTFKDPVTVADINDIESTWGAAKTIAPDGGRTRTHNSGNLARYMFDKRCRFLKLDRTKEFFTYAAKIYNPLQPDFRLSRSDFDLFDEDCSSDD